MEIKNQNKKYIIASDTFSNRLLRGSEKNSFFGTQKGWEAGTKLSNDGHAPSIKDVSTMRFGCSKKLMESKVVWWMFYSQPIRPVPFRMKMVCQHVKLVTLTNNINSVQKFWYPAYNNALLSTAKVPKCACMLSNIFPCISKNKWSGVFWPPNIANWHDIKPKKDHKFAAQPNVDRFFFAQLNSFGTKNNRMNSDKLGLCFFHPMCFPGFHFLNKSSSPATASKTTTTNNTKQKEKRWDRRIITTQRELKN